jgi:hypothetical protein
LLYLLPPRIVYKPLPEVRNYLWLRDKPKVIKKKILT